MIPWLTLGLAWPGEALSPSLRRLVTTVHFHHTLLTDFYIQYLQQVRNILEIMIYSWGLGISANQKVNLGVGRKVCPIANEPARKHWMRCDLWVRLDHCSSLLLNPAPSLATCRYYNNDNKIYTYAYKNNDKSIHWNIYTQSI